MCVDKLQNREKMRNHSNLIFCIFSFSEIPLRNDSHKLVQGSTFLYPPNIPALISHIKSDNFNLHKPDALSFSANLALSRNNNTFLSYIFYILSAIANPNLQRFIQHMKLAALLVLVALLQLSLAGTLVNTPLPAGYPSGPAPRFQPLSRQPVSRSVTATIIDAQIRATYWYYLPGAFLTYVAHIDSHDGCLYLHLYKNYVGTFLAISNYADITGQAIINTFVRVGAGCTDYAEISAPISVQTFVISLNLGAGEYFVPHEDNNNNFTESWARSKYFKKQADQDRVHRTCQKVEKYIKEQYWYYLTPDTKNLDFSESSPNGTGCYCSFTYINYVGLFQVIGQWDYQTNQPVVNTFVRLGDGSDPNEVTKCNILPSLSR